MLTATGLSTHRWNTALRSLLLLAGFPLLLALLCFGLKLAATAGMPWSWGSRLRDAWHAMAWILPLAFLGAGIWFAVAWAFSQRLLDLASDARPVTRRDEPRLWNLLETLCISRGLRMPRLAVIESPARNAYASGLGRDGGAVTVTRGLLDALDDRELAAVLAHELTHIRNGDARLGVIAAVFAGIIGLAAELVLRGALRAGPGRGRWGGGRDGGRIGALLAMAVAAIAWTLALALRMALSRNREYLADAGAVALTGDADAMAAALRKVAGHSAMPEVPAQVRALFLDDADAAEDAARGFSPAALLPAGWLATHPAMEDRIGALVRYAGARDPGPATGPSPAADPAPGSAAATPAGTLLGTPLGTPLGAPAAGPPEAAGGTPGNPPGEAAAPGEAVAQPWWRGPAAAPQAGPRPAFMDETVRLPPRPARPPAG
ncbi:M48 family metalloprotease [Roseomonas sp. NAR14]|uniref:M48 family metalloprotease n=1 Tax=Roseomonas acroporae TaxID=2937791 RepID=A0A9X1Y7V2_9PROT|nr:M48 family metalloprotease [Roseomonas acroporae]MCK8785764.1 M48 family metalloprotease [Roseomonas acroporae]